MNRNKNWNCENDKCTDMNGEVRLLPTGGDGNAIVCRTCFNHEMNYRKDEIRRGREFQLPKWEDLKVYDNV